MHLMCWVALIAVFSGLKALLGKLSYDSSGEGMLAYAGFPAVQSLFLMLMAQVVREIASVSQLRHDLRNQVQVVSALAERGDAERARELIDDLIRCCR